VWVIRDPEHEVRHAVTVDHVDAAGRLAFEAERRARVLDDVLGATVLADTERHAAAARARNLA